MVSVNDLKVFCLYCRGEIKQIDKKKLESGQLQQYHQQCFEEIIKDNHCEYCSKFLNELNELFTEKEIKIHQKCLNELKQMISIKLEPFIADYLKQFPLKILAKESAFYQMKGDGFTPYVKEVLELTKPELPTFSTKTTNFKTFVSNTIEEILQKELAESINNKINLELYKEMKKCRTLSKKEVLEKTLHFVWVNYLEIPIAYKGNRNQKIMPRPVLDTVNYNIFHYQLEKIFLTKLDFNSMVNNNYNDITDYLIGQPIAIQHLINVLEKKFNN